MKSFSRLMGLLFLGAVVYLAISYIVWGWQIIPRIGFVNVGCWPNDPIASIWTFYYWHYAIIHRAGLYFTPLQWAPFGLNLTHALSMPLMGAIAFPLTKYFGSVISTNIFGLILCAVSGLAGLFFFRLFTKSGCLAILGGFIYGFSSYQLAHLLGLHIVLISSFLLPIILYFITQQTRQEFSSWWVTPIVAIFLVAQFLISEETYATFAFFIVATLVIAYVIMKDQRAIILRLFFTVLIVYFISVLLLSPYILHFIQDKNTAFSKDVLNASIDLTNFIIPTPVQLVGGNWFNIITQHYVSNVLETTGYIGLPVLFILIQLVREFWRNDYVKCLVISITFILLCAMGPVIHIVGKNIFPGVWMLFYKLPFLEFVMPGRFMVFAFLLIPLAIFYWVEHSTVKKRTKIIVCTLIFLSFIPSPFLGAYQKQQLTWYAPLHTPAFLKNNLYKSIIKKNAIVLELPLSGNICYWQVKTNMYFRIANGCIDGPGEYSPVMMQLKAISDWNATATPGLKKLFTQYIATHHVQYIIVENKFVKNFLPALSSINTQATVIGSHTIYRVKQL